MFTGLVEGLATVRALTPAGSAVDLVVTPAGNPDSSVQIGESIAINGCCLTVVRCHAGTWTFQAGSETLSRTNLGRLQPGDRVNFERSLRVGDRLGGHFVQGHIDGTGRVERINRDGEWVHMQFSVDSSLTRQMVVKGSIAVDGVSLTLVSVGSDSFSVALIPHTLDATTLGTRRVGDAVNIETDIVGKYLEKLLAAGSGQWVGPGDEDQGSREAGLSLPGASLILGPDGPPPR
jgi:riboflavin synthase